MKSDKDLKNDWRLQGQDKYLYGKELIGHEYEPYRKGWDHDHCEFCGKKVSLSKEDDNWGYSTVDNYHWVCVACFQDFKKMFSWTIKNKE